MPAFLSDFGIVFLPVAVLVCIALVAGRFAFGLKPEAYPLFSFLGRMKWRASFVATAVFAAVIGLVELFCPLYRVRTSSMEPTVYIDDGVAVRRHAYRSLVGKIRQPPSRGDIIAYTIRGHTFLFRVVAVPSDVVQIKSQQLFVNGAREVEPYVVHGADQILPNNPDFPEPYRSRDHFGPVIVQPGHCFVLGDNRDYSLDSRYSGSIPITSVVGKVVHIFRIGAPGSSAGAA